MKFKLFFATFITSMLFAGAAVSMAMQATSPQNPGGQPTTQTKDTNEAKKKSKPKKAAEGVEKGAKDTGKAVGKGGEKAGEAAAKGTEDAAKATATGAKDASKATAKGAKKAGKTAADTVEKPFKGSKEKKPQQ
jgi:hypothetical protein